jgi:hypothetical protein
VSTYTDIKETLDSPGMLLVMKELEEMKRDAYEKYRTCATMEQVMYLQALQVVIDTAIPGIFSKLMNKHLDPKVAKKTPEWWHFKEWYEKLTR